MRQRPIEDSGFRQAGSQKRHSLTATFDDVPQDLSTLLETAPPATPSQSVILTGSVEAAPNLGGITDCCFSTPHGKHLIRFYLRHLLLAATGGGKDGSRLLGNQTKLTLPGLSQEAATQHLRNLLTCYLIGHYQPLPIFERYSTGIVLNPNTADKEFYDSYRGLGERPTHTCNSSGNGNKLPERRRHGGDLLCRPENMTTNETTST